VRARRRRHHASIAAFALRRAHGGGEPINVTPLIDVVMVLIIFYLMVGHLVVKRRGDIDLPRARDGEVEPSDLLPIIVLVDPEGVISVDGVGVRKDRTGPAVAELRAAGPPRPVQLRADRGVPFGQIRPVLRSLRESGIGAVQMAAREDEP